MFTLFEEIKQQAQAAALELCSLANLKEGNIVVIGCSTSEVAGHKIGTHSIPELANALFDG